jgi:hypothetical protein
MKNGLGASVDCHRCGGVMAYENFYGLQEHFWGWRCILCGEIVDRVILENRQWTKTKEKGLKAVERVNSVCEFV